MWFRLGRLVAGRIWNWGDLRREAKESARFFFSPWRATLRTKITVIEDKNRHGILICAVAWRVPRCISPVGRPLRYLAGPLVLRWWRGGNHGSCGLRPASKKLQQKKKVYSVIVQDDDCLVWTDPHCAFFFFLPLGRCRWPALGGKTRPIASEKRKIAHTNTLDASISTWDAPDGERRWRRRGANRHAVPGSILLQHTYPPPSSSSSCEHFRRLRIILRIIAVF